MSERPSGGPADGPRARRHPTLVALAALLLLEAGALAGLTVFLVFELITAEPDSLVSAIALTLMAAGATAWLFAMAAGALRGATWIRGAAITVSVLQIAVAVGAFQGSFARPDVGWLLLAPAVTVLVLLFTGPVIAATRRDPRS